MRPIVSFIRSPTYYLSKHLSHLLSPLVGNSNSNVSNSKHFAKCIAEQHIQEKKSLVSFDVVSLFTNVSRDLALEVVPRRLEMDDTLQEQTNLNVQSILSLLHICLNATFLAFRGQYYQHISGTAMGSPVSVTIANMVLEEIEERASSTFSPAPHFLLVQLFRKTVYPSFTTI